ncbi:energy transducer TonB, partial [Acidaminococcus timonensis]
DLSQDAALQGYSRIYPRAARDAGEEGVAVVGVSVSAGGSVTRAWLEQSTGYDRLDRAALKAAYQWSFTPARNAAGEPIAGESRVTVRYQLEE